MEEHSWVFSENGVLNRTSLTDQHSIGPQPGQNNKLNNVNKLPTRKSTPTRLGKPSLNASRKYAKAAVLNCSNVIVSSISKSKPTFQSKSSRKLTKLDDDSHTKANVQLKRNCVEKEPTKISANVIAAKNNHYTVSDDKSSTKIQKVYKSQIATLSLDKARKKLSAARFRHLNEYLYTKTGDEAFDQFRIDPESFQVYHEGFKLQASQWPVKPLDIVIQQLSKMPDHIVIADFGCGEAQLAEQLQSKTVYSFDLVALKPFIIACNIAKVPLKSKMIDVAVFCLSLMGTDQTKYLLEANRVLKMGGSLLITEVASRFFSISKFVKQVEQIGFHLNHQEYIGKMFLMFSFKKVTTTTSSSVQISLKPCLYKRR